MIRGQLEGNKDGSHSTQAWYPITREIIQKKAAKTGRPFFGWEATGHRPPATGHSQLATGHRLPATQHPLTRRKPHAALLHRHREPPTLHCPRPTRPALLLRPPSQPNCLPALPILQPPRRSLPLPRPPRTGSLLHPRSPQPPREPPSHPPHSAPSGSRKARGISRLPQTQTAPLEVQQIQQLAGAIIYLPEV